MSTQIPSITCILPTPAFAACTTNTREGLVKVVTCSDVYGVGWTCGEAAHAKLHGSKAMHHSSTHPPKVQVHHCT